LATKVKITPANTENVLWLIDLKLVRSHRDIMTRPPGNFKLIRGGMLAGDAPLLALLPPQQSNLNRD
jgi:hypothetical protein